MMARLKSAVKKALKRLMPASLRRTLRLIQLQIQVDRVLPKKKIVSDRNLSLGVTLIGDLQGCSGLAEASRGTRSCIQALGIPVDEICMVAASLKKANSDNGITLIHTNPDCLANICKYLPSAYWGERYLIGEWAWEQERLPSAWVRCIPLFDEIWAPSEFTAKAIRRETDIPVQVVPLVVSPICDESCDRETFGLPEDLFLCLIAFDYYSVMERKNPEGAINAYKKAFSDCKENVGLVIKTRNLTDEAKGWLEEQLKEWPNVFILNHDYTHEQVNSLVRSVNVYISLHRAEGFGLVMAEAMSLGTPVIATNWSGNTEFMNADVACMVDAEITTLQKDYIPFMKGSRWAEPNVQQAAEYLVRLYENPEWRNELSNKAQKYISQKLSVPAVSELIGERLREIAKKRGLNMDTDEQYNNQQ